MTDNNKKTHLIVTGRGGGSGTQVQADWNQTDDTQVDYIKNKPTIPAAPVQSDWNEADSSSLAYINNKPTIPPQQWFGTQAEYDAIVVKDPNVIYNIEGSDNVQADWNQSDSSADDYIKNKPTIPATPVQSNWNESDSTSLAYIQNKPTIPAAQVNSDWNATSGVAQILNKPTLATVATSGSYNDLTNKPTIPAAQVNSDWNATSGVAQILNKPNLAPVATSGSYSDLYHKPQLSTVATTGSYTSLKNKPTVPDETETLTFTLQGGTTVTMDVYVKPDYAKTYFFVQDLSGNGSTYTIETMDGDTPSFDVYTSTDQQNWTLLGTVDVMTTLHTTVPANGKLYIKATTDRWGADEMSYCDAPYAIGGNIMSLLYGDNFANVTAFTPDNYQIIMFGNHPQSETNLYDASKLILPATTLTDSCYYRMFDNCKSLTTAPALPATTLAGGCYSQMFYNCYSLTDAPALPAQTLAGNCYEGMFEGCIKLTTAPALPATTLAISCYMGMFRGCGSLVEAPELPAPTLEEQCYMSMFEGCASLDRMSVYATDISAMDCIYNWLNNVAATGLFSNWGGASYTSGASGIPVGWSELH